MDRDNDLRSLIKRYGVNASRIILALFMIAGVLLPAGAAPVLGAPLDEPSAPDATARCDDDYAGPDPWTCEDVEDPLWGVDDMTDRYFRYKSDGTPCLAFGHDGLYYACYDENTNTWDGVDAPIDADPLVGSHAALAFNSNDTPYISYYDATNGALKLAYEDPFSPGTWYTQTIVVETTSCPWGGVAPTMAIPETETMNTEPDYWLDAFISGDFWMEKLKPAAIEESQPGAPAVPEQDYFGVGKYTSIAFDAAGRLHISFFNDFEGELQYYFWDLGADKQCRTIDDPGDTRESRGNGMWTSIATSGSFSNPTIHISYFNNEYDQLKYARSVGYAKFNTYEITPRAEPSYQYRNGPFSSIAIDNDDGNIIPVISYLRYTGRDPEYINGDLLIANVDDPEDPDFTTVDGSSDSVGGYTSIAFEDDRDMRISHYNFTDGDLKRDGSTLRSTGNVGRFTSIDTYWNGSTQTRGIAYLDDTEGELVVIQRVGGSINDPWEALGVNGYVAKFGNVGKHSSLVIREVDDIPFISYYNQTSEFLKYAYGTFKIDPPPPIYNWTTSTVTDDYPAGTFTSIKITDLWDPTITPGDGQPVIAFYRPWDDIEDEGEDLMFARWDDFPPGWVFEELDTYGDVGKYVDMAVDSNGVPHISYYDDSRGRLNYAHYNTVATSWMTDTLDKPDNVDLGLFTSIDMSENNRIYVAYYDKTNERIKYIYKTSPTSWALPQVLVDNVGDGDHPEANLSLAYENVSGGNDRVHVSYYESTTGDLKYYKGEVNPGTGELTQLQNSTLVSSGDVGMYNDIIVNDDTEEINICYYDATNRDLEVRQYDGATWGTPFIVDQEGDVGSYCSIYLEHDDGDVTISYYDATRGSLMFAHNPYTPSVPDIWEFFLPMMMK